VEVEVTEKKSAALTVTSPTALVVDGHAIRRDGEMWCLTDLWRAAGAPKDKRPNEWLRFAGAPFVEFMKDSLDTGPARISVVRTDRGRDRSGNPGATWGHWQIALAYAKSLSHEFHARVNDVYRAFMAGQLVPAESRAVEELLRISLRIKALDVADYTSVWDRELKAELARLRKIDWTPPEQGEEKGSGREPPPLSYAYGRTWRLILGDTVYEELKRRNPYPKSGTLHGQWLSDECRRVASRESFVIALVLARRSGTWAEYESEMKSHFRRTPIQLRLVKGT
jgi:hypothetical protein